MGYLPKHPALLEALCADAAITLRYRGERSAFRGRLDCALQIVRLMWASDAFFAQACYRFKARMQSLGVPLLPGLAHRLAMMSAQVCIGDPVRVHPGIYIAHGQVVIDGITEVESGVVLFPWVTLGLKAGDFQGPVVGRDVHIGSGAKLIGPIRVGQRARVGANAVVLEDVPAGATVVGAPARMVKP